MKTLCLFVFHEINERVYNFIKYAVFNDNCVDFIFISNNTDIRRDEINLPEHCKFLSRENIGWDFGGWSYGLLHDNLYINYDYFIFVNSTVSGPYLPSYYKSKWTDIYIDGLKDNIKLFGSTINTIGDPINKSHVQSYIFSMDINTLKYLIECKIFSIVNYAKSYDEAIQNKEIGMSRRIIEKGWNIGCLMNYYNGIDFTFKTKQPSEYGRYFFDDVMFQPFYNVLWNKYELVFVKGNRVNVCV